jgi:hypothetical protein
MARKPRIHNPGAVYHVILRGNAGHPIFFDDRDRLRLYLFLQRAVEQFDCRIHALQQRSTRKFISLNPYIFPADAFKMVCSAPGASNISFVRRPIV